LKCAVETSLPQYVLHQRELIARIVDDEVSGEIDLWRFSSKQSRAQSVKRGEPHAAAIRAEQGLDTRPHLGRRLVGERDGKNAVGFCESLADEVSDAMGDDTRLARTGAGQDEKRPFGFENSVPLFGIET
jgi:hypothetical protein